MHLNIANYRTRGEENNVNGKERMTLLLNGSLGCNFSFQIILNIKNKCLHFKWSNMYDYKSKMVENYLLCDSCDL
jgi:hypothetical protein